MSAIDRSPTLAKLAEESPKDCTLRGADRSWFCGAERYEEAIVDLEEQLAGAVDLLAEIYESSGAGGDLAERVNRFLGEKGR